jgi:CSLREA domain-containing protein
MKHTFISKLFNQCTLVALCIALVVSVVQVTPVYAASILVNSNADIRLDDGKCTLREAIDAANLDKKSGSKSGECAAGSGTDTISFASNYTITLGSQLPTITRPVTIIGKGATNTIIQANATPNVATWRVFQVAPNNNQYQGSLSLDGVTVRNGRCDGSCTIVGDILSNAGGGIYNSGTLTVTNSVISDNFGGTPFGGGGIYNDGTLTVINSTFTRNIAIHDGGGILNYNGSATVINSIFSGNTADSEGAGSYSGGGISNDGIMSVTNSTFTGNIASYGGGLVDWETLTVTNSTIAGNIVSGWGGGINSPSNTTTLKNTIVASNTGNTGGNCHGTITDGGNNLDSGNTCGWGSTNGSMSNTNPMLGSLAHNGGPTQTMALLAGSPAIDAGNASVCSSSPVNGVDQRGMSRPQGAGCDIGAYEYNGTFWDVPLNYWAWDFIERLYKAGITGGCNTSPLRYCPETVVTRAQMAVLLLRGIHGSSYTPPAVGSSTGFADVPTTYWAAAWIKQLAAEGITGGCGSGNYCPEVPVTRAQMAIFLLRSEHGGSYTPPAVGGSTGFGDVPTTYWAAAWIKQLVVEGITAGCGTGTYCPESPVTRAQMAVFLVRTFNLP